jgi:hypothetical protein
MKLRWLNINGPIAQINGLLLLMCLGVITLESDLVSYYVAEYTLPSLIQSNFNTWIYDVEQHLRPAVVSLTLGWIVTLALYVVLSMRNNIIEYYIFEIIVNIVFIILSLFIIIEIMNQSTAIAALIILCGFVAAMLQG